jgi:hypothetical protein
LGLGEGGAKGGAIAGGTPQKVRDAAIALMIWPFPADGAIMAWAAGMCAPAHQKGWIPSPPGAFLAQGSAFLLARARKGPKGHPWERNGSYT